MKLKRLLVAVVAAGLMLAGAVSVQASVHYTNGVPKQLVGKYWRTKIKYGTGNGYPKGFPSFIYVHATKHSFYVKGSGADGLGFSAKDHISYYRNSAHHWYIAGDNPHSNGGDYEYFDVKTSKNYKTLKVSNLYFDSDWDRHRTYTKCYQFYHFPKWHGRAVK